MNAKKSRMTEADHIQVVELIRRIHQDSADLSVLLCNKISEGGSLHQMAIDICVAASHVKPGLEEQALADHVKPSVENPLYGDDKALKKWKADLEARQADPIVH